MLRRSRARRSCRATRSPTIDSARRRAADRVVAHRAAALDCSTACRATSSCYDQRRPAALQLDRRCACSPPRIARRSSRRRCSSQPNGDGRARRRSRDSLFGGKLLLVARRDSALLARTSRASSPACRPTVAELSAELLVGTMLVVLARSSSLVSIGVVVLRRRPRVRAGRRADQRGRGDHRRPIAAPPASRPTSATTSSRGWASR